MQCYAQLGAQVRLLDNCGTNLRRVKTTVPHAVTRDICFCKVHFMPFLKLINFNLAVVYPMEWNWLEESLILLFYKGVRCKYKKLLVFLQLKIKRTSSKMYVGVINFQ